jgi:hypothetical protein
MQQSHHDSRSYSSFDAYDEIRTFFKGPVYLLLFKIPLLLTGIALYAAYDIVKFLVVQLIELCYGIIKNSEWLINNICYYIILVCTTLAIFVQYWGKEFYNNILQPIGFFVYNYILPAIFNALSSIVDTIMCFCDQFYQLILPPTARFCYIYVIVPSSKSFYYVWMAFHSAFNLLFTTLRVACVWIWQNITDALCLFIYNYMLLPFGHATVTICSFVHTQVLPPVGKLLVYIAETLSCWLYQFCVYAVMYVVQAADHLYYACPFIYKYMLLPLCYAIVTACSCIYTQVLTPVGKLLVHIAETLSCWLYQFLVYAVTYVVQAAVHLYYACPFVYKYMLLPLCHAIVTACSCIYTQVLTPVGRFLVYIAPIIRYRLYQFVFYPIGCLLYTVGYCSYGFVLQPLRNGLSAVSTTMVNVFRVILHAVSSALNVTGCAMATTSKTIMSVLRSISGP